MERVLETHDAVTCLTDLQKLVQDLLASAAARGVHPDTVYLREIVTAKLVEATLTDGSVVLDVRVSVL
jgi:hypothetical protein